MLISRSQLKVHAFSAITAGLLTAAGVIWYVLESLAAGRLVGGGSVAGLACGIGAGSIIVFEMLLWPRKWLRRLRLIPAKYWMAAHLWLGLASLPLAIVHSGFHLGGWLPTTFMALFVLTILSGVYGVVMQNVIPRWMLRNLPAETIYSQIDYVSERTVEDARSLLIAACGRRKVSEEDSIPEPELSAPQAVVVGKLRQSGMTRGRTLENLRVVQTRQDAEPLWNALDEITPFLLHGASKQTPVTNRQQASRWFSRLRGVCSKESGFIIETFEEFCDQRRQFDTQTSAHRWLHGWLPIHVGLSVAVTVLLAAHVWSALKYW